MAYKQIRRRTKQEVEQNDGATPQVSDTPDLSQIQTDRNLMTADDALALQDVVGNRATGQMMGVTNSLAPRAGYVQPKPIIPQPARYQESSNQPAYAHIMRKLIPLSSPLIQGEQRGVVGGDGSFETNDSFESKVNKQSGGGMPLPSDLRADLEPKFGADFSGVKIHTGSEAAQLSQDVGAQAFTHGNDIYFNQGKYNPESGAGKHLLAHELTHTVQQGGSQPQAQRKPNKGWVQRDILTNWKSESSIGIFNKRSAKLKEIDKYVVDFNKLVTANDYAGIETEGAKFDALFAAWRKTKGGYVKAEEKSRFPYLKKLEHAIAIKVSEARAILEKQRLDGYSLALTLLDKAVTDYVLIPETEDDQLEAGGQGISLAIQQIATAKAEYDKARITMQVYLDQTKVDELQQAVTSKNRKEILDKGQAAITAIDDWQKTRENFDAFRVMDSDMSQYAMRSDKGMSEFKPEKLVDSKLYAGLVMPRDTGGKLSQQAMTKIGEADQDYQQKLTTKAQSGKITGVDSLSKEQLKTLMESEKNKYTGQTIYPELRNLVEPNGENDAEVTQSKNVAGVSVNVTYNASDVNFLGRLALVEAAITAIKAAGFAVPSFNLFLPKYGRQLEVTENDQNHSHAIKSSSEIDVAILMPPNTVAISSQIYQNPKVATGLSIRVDPRGVATMVHELGHFLHYNNAPEKSAGLNVSSFKGLAPDGTPWSLYISQAVSQYGSGNPREFVAEMFVGLVYRNVDITNVDRTAKENRATTQHIRKFTRNEALLKMYKALGGPIPPSMAGVFQNL